MEYGKGYKQDRGAVEFVNLREFTPIMKGEKARMFFSLTKLIDKAHNNRETLFLKFTEQYRDDAGDWHYSKKNPTIRIQDIPALLEAVKEIYKHFDDGRGASDEPAQSHPRYEKQAPTEMPDDPFN